MYYLSNTLPSALDLDLSEKCVNEMGTFAGTEFKPPVQIDIQALSLFDCDA
jgi:hypothetical protein